MFVKFNWRLNLNVMKCIFVIIRCSFLEMHFAVVTMVIMSYVLKRSRKGSQVVRKYEEGSRIEKG